jgi:hypothetical protein
MTTPAKSGATRRTPAKDADISPVSAAFGRNRAALEQTIQALEADGRLGPLDSGRVEIARGLADQVDETPESPILWREYRAAKKALREEAEAHGDPFDQLLAHLATEVRHEEKPKKAKPRP